MKEWDKFVLLIDGLSVAEIVDAFFEQAQKMGNNEKIILEGVQSLEKK